MKKRQSFQQIALSIFLKYNYYFKLYLIPHTKLTQVDHRHNNKKENYETSRIKHKIKYFLILN